MTLWAEMQSALEESLHKLSVNMCVSVFVLAFQTCTLANNGNFVCTLACVWSFYLKCERLGVHAYVCERVCESIGIPSPWAIRGQTDPIMFVLGDQIGCFPSRLAACWCSFQPAWMDNSIHFMLWTCICSLQCFWRFIWMRPSRIASVSAMCMPQWFRGQLASLAREQNVMQSVSQDWNCLLIQERYSSYYILMLNTAV